MPLLIVNQTEVLERALCLVGFSEERQARVQRKKNIERFATHFGCRVPLAHSILWEDLQKEGLLQNPTLGDLDNFLMTIHFLTKYPTELQCEALFDKCDRTVRKWVWHYISLFQVMFGVKVTWPDVWNPDRNPDLPQSTFIISVDGVHCPIWEPQHPTLSKNTKFYSHKFKGPALDYEIRISLYENKVVWVNGPFKASKHDITIFRSALKAKIPKGKLAIADLGYRGEKKIIAVPNSHDIAEVRDFKGRARARQESFNKKIKNYKVLTDKFRHGIEKHKMCFEACVLLGQHQLENGSPLFDVYC